MPHMHRTIQVLGLQPSVVTVDMIHTRARSRVLITTCGAMALHKDDLQILRYSVFVATYIISYYKYYHCDTSDDVKG